jgi:hypothetical protein
MHSLGPEYIDAIRSGLTAFTAEAGGYVDAQEIGHATISQAAKELATFVRPESLVTAAGQAAQLIESVAEHVGAFVRTITNPIQPIACWTCVRSMLESSALAAWILDPTVDAKTRVGRSLALRYEGQEQKVKFGRAAGIDEKEIQAAEARIDEIERVALGMGYAPVRDKNNRRIGIGQRAPAATDIIKMMLDEECAYRLLSAVAHGHSWAIVRLGFKAKAGAPQVSLGGIPTILFEKSVDNPANFAYLGMCAAKAFAMPLWNQCRYNGWDVAAVTVVFESVYDTLLASPAVRFWR